jgi:hypothetical protein
LDEEINLKPKKSSGNVPYCYIPETVMKVKYETNGHVHKRYIPI